MVRKWPYVKHINVNTLVLKKVGLKIFLSKVKHKVIFNKLSSDVTGVNRKKVFKIKHRSSFLNLTKPINNWVYIASRYKFFGKKSQIAVYKSHQNVFFKNCLSLHNDREFNNLFIFEKRSPYFTDVGHHVPLSSSVGFFFKKITNSSLLSKITIFYSVNVAITLKNTINKIYNGA